MRQELVERYGLLSEYRQGGNLYGDTVTFPIAFKAVLGIVSNASNKSEAMNIYALSNSKVELHNNGGLPNRTYWLAIGV